MLVAVGGLLAMAAGVGVGRFVYTPILPPMVEALSLSKSQAGLIASANFVGYLAGALLAAMRLPGSRRSWLLGSLAVNAGCLAAMGLATQMPVFLALRLVAGIVSAFILVLSSALVLDRLAASGKGALSAVHFAGVGVGIAASAALVSMFSDWQTMWFASAALAAVAGVAIAFLIEPDAATTQVAARFMPRTISKRFAALLAAYGLFGFGYVITATFIVAIVRASPEIAAVGRRVDATGRPVGDLAGLRGGKPRRGDRRCRGRGRAERDRHCHVVAAGRRNIHGADGARPRCRAGGWQWRSTWTIGADDGVVRRRADPGTGLRGLRP